jgi:hypothetical protein
MRVGVDVEDAQHDDWSGAGVLVEEVGQLKMGAVNESGCGVWSWS